MEILNKIQKELKAPKNQMNNFGNYKYRSCEDILEAVKPLLGEATLTLSDKILMIGDRFYVEATATLTHKGESISVTSQARESTEKKGMDVAQITGAASSYARKYALNGLFCIDDTKDADTTNERDAGVKSKPLDTTQINSILDYIAEIGIGAETKFLRIMKVSKIEDLTQNDFQRAIEVLKEGIKAKEKK
jgi:hypothetical protein